MKRWLIGSLVIALVLGCGGKKEDQGEDTASGGGGGKESSKATASSQPDPNAKPWDPAKGTVTIQGQIKFEGKAPKRRAIDTAGRAECAKHETPLLDESIIVGPNGDLKNVFVHVKKGLRSWKFTPPTQPVVLDQKGCRFEPHVAGLQVGQPLLIRNSDEFAHNVHAVPNVNPQFNFTQGGAGKEDTKIFSVPEVGLRIKCDIHGWMGSWLGVVPHPFFSVTGDDGKFVLKNLPPGEYEIEAWHEDLGKKSQTVKVADKETKAVDFSFSR